MGLIIQTTGLEQYSPGGNGRVQVMVIGGPGAGKTRWSSYFPKPIYADCEAGLASVADRKVPFVTVRNSQDMLDFLDFMRRESMKPWKERQYQTIVIDTLDAFQRKVKDEWLQANPGAQSFRGFEAWGYLDTKMQMLMTRLLNLDFNVIILVHYKDKTIREGSGENATERQEFVLQLSGDIKDSAFNDFDLVGWLGTYYEAVDGQRVKKRGLTFKDTPDKPFLKDRLNVTPPWMEVSFSDADYANLFSAVIGRMDELTESQVIGEIPTAASNLTGSIGGGALPEQDPRQIPLAQYDKPTLQKEARQRGLEFKSNTVKAELIQMIEEHDRAQAASPGASNGASNGDVPADSDAAPAPEAAAENADAGAASAQPQAPAETAAAASAPAVQSSQEPPASSREEPAAPEAPAEQVASTPVETAQEASAASEGTAPAIEDAVNEQPAAAPAGPASTPVQDAQAVTEAVPEGQVNTATGELDGPPQEPTNVSPTQAEAVEAVQSQLGGQVVSDEPTAEAQAAAPAEPAQPPAPSGEQQQGQQGPWDGQAPVCADCGKSLEGENQDYVKLSFIKFRRHLCNAHYLAAKKARA